jgi:hypothetical protein
MVATASDIRQCPSAAWRAPTWGGRRPTDTTPSTVSSSANWNCPRQDRRAAAEAASNFVRSKALKLLPCLWHHFASLVLSFGNVPSGVTSTSCEMLSLSCGRFGRTAMLRPLIVAISPVSRPLVKGVTSVSRETAGSAICRIRFPSNRTSMENFGGTVRRRLGIGIVLEVRRGDSRLMHLELCNDERQITS